MIGKRAKYHILGVARLVEVHVLIFVLRDSESRISRQSRSLSRLMRVILMTSLQPLPEKGEPDRRLLCRTDGQTVFSYLM